MIKIICLIFIICLSNEKITPRRIQELQTISIISYGMNNCELNDKEVIINLSQTIEIENEEEENTQAILSSSVQMELNSTLCTLQNDNLSFICKFDFPNEGIYYLKSLTSKSYKYLIQVPLFTQIRYRLNECTPSFDSLNNILNKQSYFEIGECLPELYAQKNENDIYYKISCYTIDSKSKCKFPSNLEVNEEEVTVNLVYREKCGALKLATEKTVIDFYLSGEKYININDASNIKYYYTLTTTEKLTEDKDYNLQNIDDIDAETITLFDKCNEIHSVVPYKYNCSIQKDHFSKGIYELSDHIDNIIEQVIVVYEPEIIEFKETPIVIDSKTPNNETKVVSLYFKTDVNIEDTPNSSVRGITFKSNSHKIKIQKPCSPKEDNNTIVECKLIIEDDCFLSFYYKNKTEQYVLINKEPIIIGNGIPSSYNNNNSSFNNITIYFVILIVFLFL